MVKTIEVDTKYNGKVTLEYSKTALNAPKYGASDLRELYPSHYSDKKAEADKYVRDIIESLNGCDIAYIGSSFTYSVGFRFFKNGVWNRGYITKDHNRYCPIA